MAMSDKNQYYSGGNGPKKDDIAGGTDRKSQDEKQ
jgi:hypothetical protein